MQQQVMIQDKYKQQSENNDNPYLENPFLEQSGV